MAQVTIFGHPRSTYVRTARMVCEEKGVDYDNQPLAPRTPELCDLNPLGKIPAMRHGEMVLFETLAIATYLDEVFDGPSLQPREIPARARMLQWVSAINDSFYDTMIRRYVLQYVFPKGADGQPDRAVIDTALDQMRTQLDLLDRSYGDRQFLVGSVPSLADLFWAPILAYVRMMPEADDLLTGRHGIEAGWKAISARPSFERTQPPLGEP